MHMKAISSIVLLFISSSLFAQISMVAKGAYSITSFRNAKNIEFSNEEFIAGIANGWEAGLQLRGQIGKHLFLEPELQARLRGAKLYMNEHSERSQSRIELLYLALPVNLIYKMPLAELTDLRIGGGGYVARAVYGTEIGSGRHAMFGNYLIRNRIEFDSEGDGQRYGFVKPWDAGYNLVAGIAIKKISFDLVYSSSFTNVFTEPQFQGKTFRNTSLSFAIGYNLLGKNKK